jgi:phosphoribosylformylglycinamidine synthase
MEIWEVGPEATENLAGSCFQRVVEDRLGGRPTAPQPETARDVIELAAALAHQVPVLHDVSSGGLAVTVAEICIASRVGADIWVEGYARLFSEDPHRFVVMMEPGTVTLPNRLARHVGTVGGDVVRLAEEKVGLDLLMVTYREAIPRRMRG